MCDGVGVGWRAFQGADGDFPSLLATFIFVSAFPSRRDPPNLVDMIMALNGGLWIPPTTQMNCRVHIYSNECVQPRKVSTSMAPLKCIGLCTSNTCSHAQGQVCSKDTSAARGFNSGSSSSLVHALAPTSPPQAYILHREPQTNQRLPKPHARKAATGANRGPEAVAPGFPRLPATQTRCGRAYIAPADHRLVNFESQGDDWLWRERGIARSDDAGCCGIMERGLGMSKLCVRRCVEG